MQDRDCGGGEGEGGTGVCTCLQGEHLTCGPELSQVVIPLRRCGFGRGAGHSRAHAMPGGAVHGEIIDAPPRPRYGSSSRHLSTSLPRVLPQFWPFIRQILRLYSHLPCLVLCRGIIGVENTTTTPLSNPHHHKPQAREAEGRMMHPATSLRLFRILKRCPPLQRFFTKRL